MKPSLLTHDALVMFLVILGIGLVAFYSILSRRESKLQRRLQPWQVLLMRAMRVGVAVLVLLALARPAISLVRTEERVPVVALVLDESTSMSFPEARENPLAQNRPLDRRQRFHTAQEVVMKVQDRLALTHRVKLYTFSDALKLYKEIPLRESDDAPALSQNEIFPEEFKPTGEYSNVGDALTDTLRELSNDRISGIVLLTDGRETGGAKIADVAQVLETGKIPVHAVATGSEFPLRDLRIDEVIVDAEASLGDVASFRLKITNQIANPLETTLTLYENEKKVSTKTLRLPRGTSFVAIGAVMETEGLREFRLSLPKQPDEVNVENNEQVVHVEVVKRGLRVLLISSTPSREYFYLVPALLRDPILDLRCFLQTADVDYTQQGRSNLERLPKTTQDWDKYDVVILYDVDPNGLESSMIAGLEATVSNGAGLLVFGGFNHGTARLIQVHAAKMRGLLPVEIDKNQVLDWERAWNKPFKVRRTPAGKVHPITLASTNEKFNEKIWENFPEFYWVHPVKGVKTKAVTLLERDGPREEGGGEPLVAIHRYGRGAVLYSAINGMWRWRFPAESYDYDRFWSGAIRYLGQTRLSGTQQNVLLQTDRRTYAPGEEVQITLRLMDPALQSQIEGQQLYADVMLPSKDLQKVPLKPEVAGAPTYRGSYRPREVGSMLLHCKQAAPNADSEAKPLFDVKHNFHVRMESLEDRDTSANLEGLQALSEQTGGSYWDHKNMQDVATLVDKIPSEPQVLSKEVQIEVWDGTLFLILFLLLVSAEWSLRKWWGLL